MESNSLEKKSINRALYLTKIKPQPILTLLGVSVTVAEFTNVATGELLSLAKFTA